jgi:hypothetical protein
VNIPMVSAQNDLVNGVLVDLHRRWLGPLHHSRTLSGCWNS